MEAASNVPNEGKTPEARHGRIRVEITPDIAKCLSDAAKITLDRKVSENPDLTLRLAAAQEYSRTLSRLSKAMVPERL